MVSAALLVCALPSGAALAGAPAEDPTLAVFEIYYRGKPSGKTAEYAAKIEQRIVKEGGFDVINRIDAEKLVYAKYPKSQTTSLEESADEVKVIVEEASRIFFEKGGPAAIEKLREAREKLQRIVDSMSLSEEMKKGYIDTQMLLALIYLKGDAQDKAEEVMRTLVRQVGQDASINTDNYHPDAVALYRDVYRRMSEQRVGKISVRSNPPGADVYINGIKQEKSTPAVFEGLFPGEVRIQVKKGDRESHVRRVLIETGTVQEFDVDLAFESALAFGNDRYGLSFVDVLDRKRNLGAFAARLGELVGVDYVAVIGLGEEEGESKLEGHLIQVETDKVLRGTGMNANPNVVSKRRIGEMAYYVMYGITEFGTSYLPWYENTKAWILTGVGVAGGALGGLFYSMYKSDEELATCQPDGSPPAGEPDHYPCRFDEQGRQDKADSAEGSRTAAYVSWGVGAAGLVGGILLFIFDKEEDPDAEVKPVLPGTGIKTTRINPIVTPQGDVGLGATFTF